MLRPILTAAFVLSAVSAASATSPPDTLLSGSIAPVFGDAQNSSDACGAGMLISNTNEYVPMTVASTFQRGGTSKTTAIVSFGTAGLFYASSNVIELWGGDALMVFSNSHDGTLQFDVAPIYLTGAAGTKDTAHTSLSFSGYQEKVSTAGGILTVTVSFTAAMPASCTVPVTGVYHAPK